MNTMNPPKTNLEVVEQIVALRPALAARIIVESPFFEERKELWMAGWYSQREYNKFLKEKEALEAAESARKAAAEKLEKMRDLLAPFLKHLQFEQIELQERERAGRTTRWFAATVPNNPMTFKGVIGVFKQDDSAFVQLSSPIMSEDGENITIQFRLADGIEI